MDRESTTEEEVDSVLTQQFNTNLTIEEPSNSLAIGIGAEHTRSFAETRKAVGHKDNDKNGFISD